MLIPSTDPTGYCRLCFSQNQLRWLLQSSDNPMVAQIRTCLGIVLTAETDFPCTVCRLCSAALETFEALQERAMECDIALRDSRLPSPPEVTDVVEMVVCKQECVSPRPELVGEPVLLPVVEDSGNPEVINSNNTIMVGDIKVELLDVRSENTTAESEEVTNEHRQGVIIKKYRLSPRPFKCRICEQTFVREGSLQNHMKVKHSKPEPPSLKRRDFKPISPKEIRKQLNMYSGPAVYTVKPKPNRIHYKCNMCEAQFHGWHLFLEHKRSHSNEDSSGSSKSKEGNYTPNMGSKTKSSE